MACLEDEYRCQGCLRVKALCQCQRLALCREATRKRLEQLFGENVRFVRDAHGNGWHTIQIRLEE